eukprot:scaffold241610_cov24-Attheya_sp.AAC.1
MAGRDLRFTFLGAKPTDYSRAAKADFANESNESIFNFCHCRLSLVFIVNSRPHKQIKRRGPRSVLVPVTQNLLLHS